MPRQQINRGTIANDGTGDTLRVATDKINQTFIELYEMLGGDSEVLSQRISFEDSAIAMEGQFINGVKTKLYATNPTSARSQYLPDASGTLIVDTATQTLTNKTLTSPVLTTPQINDTSATHQYVFAVNELAADRTVTMPLLTGNDTFVFANHQQTLTSKTLTTPTVDRPKHQYGVYDSTGVALLISYPPNQSTGVNSLSISNGTTGNGPTLSTAGANTDIDLNLQAKGTGTVNVNDQFSLAVENVNTSGTLSSSASVHMFTGSVALFSTLADGHDGALKYFINAGTTTMTITPSTFTQGTNVLLEQFQTTQAVFMANGANPGWYFFGDSAYIF
jgi:hypothetical protein